MKRQSPPKAATWLLQLFCSSPEHESLTGDLLEEYQNGQSRFWYWRQVLAIVAIEIFRKIARRPLMRSAKLSAPLGLVVVVIVLLATLLSDLWLFGLGVLLGVIVGCLKFAFDNNRMDSEQRAVHSLEPTPVDTFSTAEPLHIAGNIHDSPPKEASMHLHRGINITSIASEGFEGLPGLLMMIFFVFGFISLFVPRDNQWFLALFLVVEVGAAVLYLLASRRSRRDSARLQRALHEMQSPQRPK